MRNPRPPQRPGRRRPAGQKRAGWRAFRRYRTREGGRFSVGYRFTRTLSPTRYVMRAQVRETTGYPYLQGNSRQLALSVLPSSPRR
jgi:hypothetical protein